MIQLEIDACIWAEGFEKLPYKNPRGVWTCGIGHNLEARGIPASWVKPILDKRGISKKQASEILELDWISAQMNRVYVFTFAEWESFSEAQKFVVTDMIFNMGLGDKNHGFLSFSIASIPAMKRGDWSTVIANLKRSKWVKQTGRRALRDISILETDKVRIEL